MQMVTNCSRLEMTKNTFKNAAELDVILDVSASYRQVKSYSRHINKTL